MAHLKKVNAQNLLNEVINCDLAAVAEMLALKCPANVLGTCGEAPLHIAIYKRDRVMLDMLLAAGANIMFPNRNGDTAFHVAARLGLVSFIELLYSVSTDLQRKRLFLQEKNKEGLTALDIASMPVLTTELDLTRKYCSWHDETGTTLDEEAGPLQRGRALCQQFLAEMTQVDILAKEQGSVEEMSAQNNSFQKTASVLRGNHYATSSARIFYSELDYPARQDPNAWIESDRKFFLNYLPGVRKVITKLHSADFVAKTVRSGYDNAQLVIRRGEGNSYVLQEAQKRQHEVVPAVPEEFAEGVSDENERNRLYLGRRNFAAESEQHGEQSDPKKYNADGSPKTIAELRAEVAALESSRISALHAIQAHERPPMSRVYSNNLQAAGSGGVGKIEEGLFSIGNTHGQPSHAAGNFKAVDSRFARPIHIPTDDRPSVQGNMLRSISLQADKITEAANARAHRESADKEIALQAERDAYNKHMTFHYKHKL